jgi:multidrug efflux pump subunit AcrA (membrane-fusion protein)
MKVVRQHSRMAKHMQGTGWLCGGLLAAAVLLQPDASFAQNQSTTPAARAVTTVKASRSCFDETIQVTGAVGPRNEVLIRSDREGAQISQVLVEAGDSVSSGQVLARLRQQDGQRAGDNAVQASAAGVIFASAAVVGGTISSAGEPLFRIARDNEMEIVGETTADSMARLKLELPATVEIVGVGEINGKVRLIATSVNPTTQLGQVHISIGNDPRLRVGVFGKATIRLSQRCGPALPLSAVLYGTGGQFVQVVRSDRVETRRVEIGIVRKGEAELRSGVSEGEIVVARSGSFVRDGDVVLSVPAPQASSR